MLLYLGVMICLAADARAANPTYCSLPNQWSAIMSHVPAVTNGATEFVEFYYDYNVGKIALEYYDFSTNPSTFLNRTVIDYNTGEFYQIDDATSTCLYNTTFTGVNMFPPSFTTAAGVSYYGTNYVGALVNSLDYEAWRIPLGTTTLTVINSVPECVPILMGVTGTFAGGAVDDVQFFSGYNDAPFSQTVFDTCPC